MADIAFLLLIFFLVTTDIATDSGLNRKLPPWEEDPQDTEVVIKEKNIFTINVNSADRIMVTQKGESDPIDLDNLRKEAVKFLDNGGGKGADACKYCKGARDPRSSDNFDKAVISLSNNRLTKYKTYIAVQNEIIAAYNEIRNREFIREYPGEGINYVQANDEYLDPATPPNRRENLKTKLEAIRILVPQKFSEAETK
ncbi:biopolymer transporter ExbD [Lacinutrix neustonica]|uniref:Biopolymer transporter ExbD n=2 Tax=Lacinutrix neustonica TaxID=2980107 RepID=A0A9E8MYQ0_9FLAO|nr:biopolymer transporter ExbD [Lacinutrix neustonica]WAC03821.1 biopolymer transporter ExbD [Lacinutrix neustonica]